ARHLVCHAALELPVVHVPDYERQRPGKPAPVAQLRAPLRRRPDVEFVVQARIVGLLAAILPYALFHPAIAHWHGLASLKANLESRCLISGRLARFGYPR